MKAQFNFQLRQRNDKSEWENIGVYYQTYCDRITAIRYARNLSKTFHPEVRLTEGKRATKNEWNIYLRTNRTFKNYKLWQIGVATRLLLRATKSL